MQKLLKLSIAAATLSSTALFADNFSDLLNMSMELVRLGENMANEPPSSADPFTGAVLEAALGASQIKSEAWSVQTASREGFGISSTNPQLVNTSLDARKETQFAGRLGVGFGYTLPNTNLNLTGLLTINMSGEQKMKQSGMQDTGRGNAEGTDLSGWTTKLTNVFELRFQPGYYVRPLHTLVYGTIGYAWAKLDSSGRILYLYSENAARGPTVDPVGQGIVNLNGYVLGVGAKFSIIPPTHLYVGVDYSRISYNSKKMSEQIWGYRANGNGIFPVWWEGNTGKIKTDTVLVTVGYYF